MEHEFGRIAIGPGDFGNLDDQQMFALYNYNFVAADESFGGHNTAYTIQILQRSYYGVYGVPIGAVFQDIDLRGPIQAASARSWSVYD